MDFFGLWKQYVNSSQSGGGMLMGSEILKSVQPRPETRDMSAVEKYKFEKALKSARKSGLPDLSRAELRKALDDSRVSKSDPEKWEREHGYDLDRYPDILETGLDDNDDDAFLDPAYKDN